VLQGLWLWLHNEPNVLRIEELEESTRVRLFFAEVGNVAALRERFLSAI
jgi:hypothetical protein